jgi:hypothetical protein
MGAPLLLDYGRSPHFLQIHWRLLLKIALACVLFAYAAMTMLNPDIRITVSLCTKCGTCQNTTEHCLPFTSIAFRRSRSQTQTPMSLVVQKHQLHLVHQHQFAVAAIHGKRQSVLGPAAILQERVHPPFSTFIDTLANYSDLPTTEKWLDRALDPDHKFSYAMAAMAQRHVPTSQSEFKIWWKRVQTGDFFDTDQPPVFRMELLPKISSSAQDEQ